MANDQEPSGGPSTPPSAPPSPESYVPGYSQAEKDELLDRMSADIRWQKAHGHFRMKEPEVSREQAVELATDVAETMGRTVREVRDLADLTIQGVRTPC